MLEALAAIGGIVCAAAGGGYLWPHGIRKWQVRQLAARVRERRALVLTYDDGPGAELTPRLLDLLAAAQAHATFFLLGRRVGGQEAIVDQLVAAGHELGCHSHEHLNAWKCWPWRAVQDLRRGYQTLAPWIPAQALFRPPHGKLILPTWWAVRRQGHVGSTGVTAPVGARLAWWTVDSGDTHAQLPDPQAVAEAVTRAGGGVVLLHDFDRQRDQVRRADFVLRMSQMLIDNARREGLQICRYGDLWKATPAAAVATRSH